MSVRRCAPATTPTRSGSGRAPDPDLSTPPCRNPANFPATACGPSSSGKNHRRATATRRPLPLHPSADRPAARGRAWDTEHPARTHAVTANPAAAASPRTHALPLAARARHGRAGRRPPSPRPRGPSRLNLLPAGPPGPRARARPRCCSGEGARARRGAARPRGLPAAAGSSDCDVDGGGEGDRCGILV